MPLWKAGKFEDGNVRVDFMKLNYKYLIFD